MKKLLDWSAGNDGAPLVDHQRQPLEHRIGAERDDDRGQPQADRQHAVDEAEQRRRSRRPASAASHGLTPATISSAATTAEKLNIQPTDRSISRIASRNTMPSDSMPWKVVLPRMVSRLIGLRKRGRATPITTIITTQRDDDADLLGQPEGASRRRARGRRATGSGRCRS